MTIAPQTWFKYPDCSHANTVRCFYANAWLLWGCGWLEWGMSRRKRLFTVALEIVVGHSWLVWLVGRNAFEQFWSRSSFLASQRTLQTSVTLVFWALYTASAGFPPNGLVLLWRCRHSVLVGETSAGRPQSEETCQDDSNLFLFSSFILLPRSGISRFCGVLLDINNQ